MYINLKSGDNNNIKVNKEMYKLNELYNDLVRDFVKVDTEYGGGLKKAVMFNPNSKDVKKITVDDTEYSYGMGLLDYEYGIENLDKLYNMKIKSEFYKDYMESMGIVIEGTQVEVAKGRKYKIGTKGTVINKYDIKDKYRRYLATYVTVKTVDDEIIKINVNNLKIA